MTRRKRYIILAVFVLLVGTLLAYGYASWRHWNAYEAQTSRVISQAETPLATVLFDANITPNERLEHLESVRTLSADCSSSWLYGWQTTILPSLDASLEECQVAENRLDEVKTAAGSLHDYLKDEAVLLDELKKLEITKSSLAPAEFNVVYTSVEKVLGTLKGFDFEDDASQRLAAKVTAQITNIKDRWQALLAADEKQDRTAYAAELAKLEKSYSDISQLSEEFEQSAEKKLTALNRAYTSLVD